MSNTGTQYLDTLKSLIPDQLKAQGAPRVEITNTRIANALIFDKESVGIDPDIRQTLKIFYARNTFIDIIKLQTLTGKVYTDEDEAIKDNAKHHSNFDYLILTYEGNIPDIYLYHENCINHVLTLDNMTNGNWLVTGQIIDQYENRLQFNDPSATMWKDSFHLFPITAIVNLRKWRQLEGPEWGQPNKQSVEHLRPVRSQENIHDNYTPLYLKGSDGSVKTPVKKGWNIIDVSLKNNMPVYNLSDNIRKSQNYLYPEVDVKLYNEFWRAVYSLPKMSSQYINVLQSLLPEKNKVLKKWACFLKNTEEIVPWGHEEKFDQLIPDSEVFILPCSGFKDFILAQTKTNHSVKKIIHYDIVPECVHIRRRILTEWDGTRQKFSEIFTSLQNYYIETQNHKNCFHMHSKTSFDDFYVELLSNFKSEQDLITEWDKFQKLEHEYVHCDILAEPWLVTNKIRNTKVYLCLSDVAGWRNILISNGYVNLRSRLKQSVSSLKNNGCTGIVDYKDPANDTQLLQSFNEFMTYISDDNSYQTIDFSWSK